MGRVFGIGMTALFALGVAAVLATSATAQGYGGNGVGPGKWCPSDANWFLTGPSPGDTVVDRNGDGLICVRAVDGRGSSRDVPGFSVRDDLYFVTIP